MILSRIHYPVTTLGPGKRIGIWFQGCSIRCAGCISADTWDRRGEPVAVADILDAVRPIATDADGVTITGGEPFEQAEALWELVAGFREVLNQATDILVYTGFHFVDLMDQLSAHAGFIDALISEPFDLSASQTKPLLGSDNQELHLLTPLGEDRFRSYDRLRTKEDDRLDLTIDLNGTAWFAGIPKLGDWTRLTSNLAAQGTRIQTTEHKVGT